MTKEEFENLKYGSVVELNRNYYIVFEQIDDQFIDTQCLKDVGRIDTIGHTHTKIIYEFANVVTDNHILDAINEWLKFEHGEYDPYSYIAGYCKAKEK